MEKDIIAQILGEVFFLCSFLSFHPRHIAFLLSPHYKNITAEDILSTARKLFELESWDTLDICILKIKEVPDRIINIQREVLMVCEEYKKSHNVDFNKYFLSFPLRGYYLELAAQKGDADVIKEDLLHMLIEKEVLEVHDEDDECTVYYAPTEKIKYTACLVKFKKKLEVQGVKGSIFYTWTSLGKERSLSELKECAKIGIEYRAGLVASAKEALKMMNTSEQVYDDPRRLIKVFFELVEKEQLIPKFFIEFLFRKSKAPAEKFSKDALCIITPFIRGSVFFFPTEELRYNEVLKYMILLIFQEFCGISVNDSDLFLQAWYFYRRLTTGNWKVANLMRYLFNKIFSYLNIL